MLIPLTKGKFAVVDPEDFDKLTNKKWQFSPQGYAIRNEIIGGKRTSVCMHRLIVDAPDGFVVDHINRNKLDNRKENLRICSQHVNLMNSGLFSHNTSGVRGVAWVAREGMWRSRIKVNKKDITIGYYHNFDDAVAARLQFEESLSGRIEPAT